MRPTHRTETCDRCGEELTSSYAHFARFLKRHQARDCRPASEVRAERVKDLVAKASEDRTKRALERLEENIKSYPKKLPTTYEDWLEILLKRLESR